MFSCANDGYQKLICRKIFLVQNQDFSATHISLCPNLVSDNFCDNCMYSIKNYLCVKNVFLCKRWIPEINLSQDFLVQNQDFSATCISLCQYLVSDTFLQ